MESSPFQHVPHTPLLEGTIPLQSPVPTVPDVDLEARISNTPSPFQRRRRTFDQCLPHTPVQCNMRGGFQGDHCCPQVTMSSEQEVPQTPIGQSPIVWCTAKSPKVTCHEPVTSRLLNRGTTNSNNNANTCMCNNEDMDISSPNPNPVSMCMPNSDFRNSGRGDRLSSRQSRVETPPTRATVHSTRQELMTSPMQRSQNTQELDLFGGDDYFA